MKGKESLKTSRTYVNVDILEGRREEKKPGGRKHRASRDDSVYKEGSTLGDDQGKE